MLVNLIPATGMLGKWDYCTSKTGAAEQINVQIVSPEAVVVSFVTFELSPPLLEPAVFAGLHEEGPFQAVTGVTHTHTTAAGDRTYYMHFIKLEELLPRTKYFYKVQSGGRGAAISKVFSFRSGYAEG